MNKKGYFFVIDGIDGSGKSLQTKLLADRLKEINVPYYETKNPTTRDIGQFIRNQCLSGSFQTDEQVITMLWAADRLDQLLNKDYGILKKINNGITVISDRYYLSSFGYQGATTSIDYVYECNKSIINLLRPTITIYINIEPDLALKRIHSGGRRKEIEIYETLDQLKKFKTFYEQSITMLKNEGEIFFEVDGSLSHQEISDKIWIGISHLFNETPKFF